AHHRRGGRGAPGHRVGEAHHAALGEEARQQIRLSGDLERDKLHGALPSMAMIATRGTISSPRRAVDTRRGRRDRTAAASWTELSLVAMTGPTVWKRLRTLVALSFVWVLTLAPLALAADAPPAGESQSQSADSEAGVPSAPVVIDGRTLFRVRGTPSSH